MTELFAPMQPPLFPSAQERTREAVRAARERSATTAEVRESSAPPAPMRIPEPPFVHVDGPYPDQDRWGDEVPVYYVAVCAGETGDAIGKVYQYRNQSAAQDLGWKMARDRRLELVDESSPA